MELRLTTQMVEVVLVFTDEGIFSELPLPMAMKKSPLVARWRSPVLAS